MRHDINGAFPLTRSWAEWRGADRELVNNSARNLHSALVETSKWSGDL